MQEARYYSNIPPVTKNPYNLSNPSPKVRLATTSRFPTGLGQVTIMQLWRAPLHNIKAPDFNLAQLTDIHVHASPHWILALHTSSFNMFTLFMFESPLKESWARCGFFYYIPCGIEPSYRNLVGMHVRILSSPKYANFYGASTSRNAPDHQRGVSAPTGTDIPQPQLQTIGASYVVSSTEYCLAFRMLFPNICRYHVHTRADQSSNGCGQSATSHRTTALISPALGQLHGVAHFAHLGRHDLRIHHDMVLEKKAHRNMAH